MSCHLRDPVRLRKLRKAQRRLLEKVLRGGCESTSRQDVPKRGEEVTDEVPKEVVRGGPERKLRKDFASGGRKGRP